MAQQKIVSKTLVSKPNTLMWLTLLDKNQQLMVYLILLVPYLIQIKPQQKLQKI